MQIIQAIQKQQKKHQINTIYTKANTKIQIQYKNTKSTIIQTIQNLKYKYTKIQTMQNNTNNTKYKIPKYNIQE